ncbi:MAG: DUF2842 domain-containing protein [Proteobacteria bacterium]|nr:DUF2842 domain-containing protein [Pseudomonadota bacterium]MBS0573410.1 DUF2842 domain-containing protein [Pseudomonadota bacterium]
MAGYRARKRWALLILLVGLPVYLVAVITVENRLVTAWGPPPPLAELVIFVSLAFLWALPFKRIFTGIGQAGPDENEEGRR